MIVRRAAYALKEQNWTTILVEFVLLVAGVFLGIQAANWNEQRVEQYLPDCDAPVTEAQAQAILDAYVRDPGLLPELRFWMANQGVAMGVIANYAPLVHDMLARTREDPTP